MRNLCGGFPCLPQLHRRLTDCKYFIVNSCSNVLFKFSRNSGHLENHELIQK